MKRQFIITTIIIFVLLSAVLYELKSYAPELDTMALEGGNAVMAILTLSAFFIVSRQVADRPAAFVRGVYSASFLKLMVCMVAMLLYIVLNREHMHKSTVFALFGVYAIYTAAETLLLSKLARTKQ